jgi:hypothetical protein
MSAHVRLGEGAQSGLANIVQQYLEQDLAEFEEKRRRASRLRGRVAMTASDHDATITLDFCGDEIVIWDGEKTPLDASIAGPYPTLVQLIQGRTNPIAGHLRGLLRVRSSLRNPLFPLKVHRLMKAPLDADARRELRSFALFAALFGAAALVTLTALLLK